MSGYAYVAVTVALTVYGQLVTKWRVNEHGDFPVAGGARIRALALLLVEPWVLSGMVATGLAGLTWIEALGELDLNVAYPFVALSFVLVMVLSARLFGEPMTRAKVAGSTLICAGLVLANVA
ncbi:MAG: EamA family transporter [Thermoleophilaceae bacterium]|nr:EamA family transporter [Thermoleophilaceae bacterium]